MQLTHIRLLTADYRACFRFYRDALGLTPAWGDEESGYADFQAGGGVSLALFARQAMAQAVGTTDLPADTAAQDRVMVIFGVEDLAAEVARLKQRGVSLAAEITEHPDWGIRTAHLRDPDGTLIELNSPMPHETWTEELKEETQRYSTRNKED